MDGNCTIKNSFSKPIPSMKQRGEEVPILFVDGYC
jgi:hypothetical protein